MITSMTGFARREASGPWGQLACELRSVNHRYLDLSIRLSDELRSLDDPNQAVFYTSGRTSNEAAFLYQLFARAFRDRAERSANLGRGDDPAPREGLLEGDDVGLAVEHAEIEREQRIIEGAKIPRQ